jgi:hypothetical protein
VVFCLGTGERSQFVGSEPDGDRQQGIGGEYLQTLIEARMQSPIAGLAGLALRSLGTLQALWLPRTIGHNLKYSARLRVNELALEEGDPCDRKVSGCQRP